MYKVLILLIGLSCALNGLDAEAQVGIEYSNKPDEDVPPPGGEHGAFSVGQVNFTSALDPPGGPLPANSVNFGGGVNEVDAIAYPYDAFFDGIVGNTATLLVSFTGDAGGAAAATVYFEKPAGAAPRGVRWTKPQLHNPNPAPGPGGGDLNDIDGTQLWGGDPRFYSREGEPAGASVFVHNPAGPAGVYLTRAQVFAALVPLGFTGAEGEVDVDALMANDNGLMEDEWDEGDEVLISIRPAANFHGGEIIHLKHLGVPGVASAFLTHGPGGNIWDNANDPQADFGTATKDVDSLEGEVYVPEPDPPDDTYSCVFEQKIQFQADGDIEPNAAGLIIQAQLPAAMDVRKGDMVVSVDLLAASLEADIGAQVGDFSDVSIQSGSGQFDAYVFDSVPVGVSNFAIIGGEGTIDWSSGTFQGSMAIVVSAVGFSDISATAAASGQIDQVSDGITLLSHGSCIENVTGSIPAVSGWGVLVMGLSVLALATLIIKYREIARDVIHA